MRLKRVQTTRFTSTRDASATVLKTFRPLINALQRLSDDEEMDNVTVSEADALLKRVTDMKFLIALCMC